MACLSVCVQFTRDINHKRGQFIAKIHSLNQEFYFADSTVLIKLYNSEFIRLGTLQLDLCLNYQTLDRDILSNL